MIFQRDIELRTAGHRDRHDPMDGVAQVATASGIRTGIVHLFNGTDGRANENNDFAHVCFCL
jgi:hypothetical protein